MTRSVVAALAVFLGACGEREPLPSLYALPAFTLVDHRGAPFTNETVAGRPWIADFVFTSCRTICPVMTERMKALGGALGDQLGAVRLVSISVDPGTDTPNVLARYVRERSLDDRHWTFVTGDTGAISDLVVRGFRVAMGQPAPMPNEPGAYDILHDTHFVLVDGAGTLRGVYDSDEPGRARLVADVERLLRERP